MVHSVSFEVDAAQFLAGWREKPGALFVPTLSECRVGDEVAIRLGIHGHPIRATLFGKVSLVRKVGRRALPPGVELQLEKHSLAAARFLAMAARGEPVTFKERVPRWAVQRDVRVVHARTAHEVRTVNVAEGGCAVEWPGPLPGIGDELTLHVNAALFARSLRAIVCWTHAGRFERTVGLKVVAGGLRGRAWRAFVRGVSRSGARAT